MSHILSSFRRKGESTPENKANPYLEQSTRATKNLERDLREMTNKCIELQVLLNEERERMNTFLSRTKSLNVKNLSQEVIGLRKEVNAMKHNAKAATWKLQEVIINCFYLFVCRIFEY